MPAHDSIADPAADDWELHFVVLGKAAGNRRRWSSPSVVWKLETFYSGLFGIAIQRLWTSSGMSFGHLAPLVHMIAALLTRIFATVWSEIDSLLDYIAASR